MPAPSLTAWRPRLRRLARTAMARLRDARGVAPGPLVIAGLFSDNRGVSQAAKLSLRQFAALGFEPVAHDVTALLHGAMPPPPPGAGGALLMHVNPPEAMPLLDSWPMATWAGRYRVGYWNWELPAPPPGWAASAPLFDEVWAPSAIAVEAFGRLMPAHKIRLMTLPAPPAGPADGDAMRDALGVPRGATLVLSGFDFRSSVARKNPEGAIAAYRLAVPAPRDDVRLLIKVSGQDERPSAYAALREAIADRPDILLGDRQFDAAGMAQLLAAADIFVSLHRAEGFGLWLAEAMRAGKAVVATGWSGNMDFMDADSAALVPFRLTPVRDENGPYAGIAADWAEPDAAAAARLLAALIEDPHARIALGERARKKAEVLGAGYANPSTALRRALGRP
jgi:glycosyltransferase involved in cell wall biosynthesis